MEKAEKTSIPFIRENKSCDHIELRRNGLKLAANIQWISPQGCTPYALGPLPSITINEATPSDCLSCKYFSGNQLLKCAVNLARMMDDDCSEFEAAANNPSRRDDRQLHSSVFLLAMAPNNPDEH